MGETTTGFVVTLQITTDNIENLLAYGRRLRAAEDGSESSVTSDKDAAAEVGYLIAAEGVNALIRRGEVYAETAEVTTTPVVQP
jgi:ribosomal protein L18